MRVYTYDAQEYRGRLRTEQDCLGYILRRKWPDGGRCPRGGHNPPSFIKYRKFYWCGDCGHETSVTGYSIFHKTREPLKLVLDHPYCSNANHGLFCLPPLRRSGLYPIRQHGRGVIRSKKPWKTVTCATHLNGWLNSMNTSYIGVKKKPGKWVVALVTL